MRSKASFAPAGGASPGDANRTAVASTVRLRLPHLARRRATTDTILRTHLAASHESCTDCGGSATPAGQVVQSARAAHKRGGTRMGGVTFAASGRLLQRCVRAGPVCRVVG